MWPSGLADQVWAGMLSMIRIACTASARSEPDAFAATLSPTQSATAKKAAHDSKRSCRASALALMSSHANGPRFLRQGASRRHRTTLQEPTDETRNSAIGAKKKCKVTK